MITEQTTWQRDGLALLFAMTFPSFMSWIEFWVLPGLSEESGPAFHQVFSLGKVVQFTFPLFYVGLVAPGELRPTRPHLRGMGLAIGFGLLVAAGSTASWLW